MKGRTSKVGRATSGRRVPQEHEATECLDREDHLCKRNIRAEILDHDLRGTGANAWRIAVIRLPIGTCHCVTMRPSRPNDVCTNHSNKNHHNCHHKHRRLSQRQPRDSQTDSMLFLIGVARINRKNDRSNTISPTISRCAGSLSLASISCFLYRCMCCFPLLLDPW